MYNPTYIETNNVFSVYDSISSHFSDTRGNVWNSVKTFLDNLHKNSYGLEIGCGNGKNMTYRNDIDMIGIDTCEQLVNICRSKNLIAKQGNAIDEIYPNNMFDFVISIAVFHHISTEEGRIKALSNMIRQIKKGGKGLLTVWAVEQDADSNKTFVPGDNLVKWHKPRAKYVRAEYDMFERYYYVYTQEMFEKYINTFRDKIVIDRIFNEKGNWFCEFTKKI